ncbi:ORF-32 [Teiidae poxvirus 1]|nr:ORF-32 [Teiidae poxvirus 1]
MMFETNRERIHIELSNKDTYHDSRAHIFAVCITTDNVPVVGIRRTSFMYQSIITSRKSISEILTVDVNQLNYMYGNEIKEICIRAITPFTFGGVSTFEELVLLGGKVKSDESIYQCLSRELMEESDGNISIKSFGKDILSLVIEDKMLYRTFYGYCILCFINQMYSELTKPLYNIEIKELTSLLIKSNNEKYEYLYFIYSTLLTCKYGRVL